MGNKIKFLINPSELSAGTRGSSLGPDAIIAAARSTGSHFFSQYSLVRLSDENHLLDVYSPHRCAKHIEGFTSVCNQMMDALSSTFSDDDFPFILAGDHGSAAGTIAGIRKHFPEKRLGVVWIDAHADIHTPYTTPSGNLHGMPLAISLGEDNIESKLNEVPTETAALWQKLKDLGFKGSKLNPEDLVFIGVRDYEPEEEYLMNKLKIRNFTVQEVSAFGTETVVQKTLNQLLPCDLIYVSFDVDAMDPKATSLGTGTPSRNGLMPKQAKELLQGLKRSPKTICVEFVEVNPCLDEKLNRMAEVAFELVQAVVAV